MIGIKYLIEGKAKRGSSMNDSEAKVRSLKRATTRALEQMMRLRKENEKLKAENERLSQENRKLKGDLQVAGVPNWLTTHLLFKPATVSQAVRKLVHENTLLMKQQEKSLNDYIDLQIKVIANMRAMGEQITRGIEVIEPAAKETESAALELNRLVEASLATPRIVRECLDLIKLVAEDSARIAAGARDEQLSASQVKNELHATTITFARVLVLQAYYPLLLKLLSSAKDAMNNSAVIAGALIEQCHRDGKPDPLMIAMLPEYHFEEGGVFEGRTPAWLANALETVARFKKWEASIEPDAKGYTKKKTRRIFVEQTSMDPKTFYNYWNAYKCIEKIANDKEVAAESEDQSDDQQ